MAEKKNPIIQKKLDSMAAFQRGVEDDLGMTLDEYANLAIDHPKKAKKVMDKAIKKAEKREKERDVK